MALPIISEWAAVLFVIYNCCHGNSTDGCCPGDGNDNGDGPATRKYCIQQCLEPMIILSKHLWIKEGRITVIQFPVHELFSKIFRTAASTKLHCRKGRNH